MRFGRLGESEAAPERLLTLLVGSSLSSKRPGDWPLSIPVGLHLHLHLDLDLDLETIDLSSSRHAK